MRSRSSPRACGTSHTGLPAGHSYWRPSHVIVVPPVSFFSHTGRSFRLGGSGGASGLRGGALAAHVLAALIALALPAHPAAGRRDDVQVAVRIGMSLRAVRLRTVKDARVMLGDPLAAALSPALAALLAAVR